MSHFKNLHKFGPCTSDEFSSQIKMDKRYIREWLLALAAAKYVDYNTENEEFSLSAEQFSILGDEDSISLMIGGFENLVGAIHNIDIIKDNFTVDLDAAKMALALYDSSKDNMMKALDGCNHIKRLQKLLITHSKA